MNIKPCKLNPTRLSPSNWRDLPKDSLVYYGRVATEENRSPNVRLAARRDAASALVHLPRRLEHIPSMGRLEYHNKISKASLEHPERYSLKPTDKCSTASVLIAGTVYCSNHNDKPSKFKITSEEINLFYCEKCAILLASQGFKVYRLESNPNQSSRRMLFEEAVAHQNSAGPINYAFQQECKVLLNEVTNVQSECEKIIYHSRYERQRVHNYFGSMTNQLDELEHQLKTSITMMVAYQRYEVRAVFDQMDVQFIQRLAELDMANISFYYITKEVNLSLKATLNNKDAEEVILRQRKSLEAIQRKIRVYSGMKEERLDLMTPNTDSLRHLADIIRDCRLGLKTYQIHQHVTTPEPLRYHLPAANTMFFSFYRGLQPNQHEEAVTVFKADLQTTAGLGHSLNYLDSNVNVILTNSDNDSEDDPNQLQYSIVDPDFSKLLANVRTC